ncbi:MAG: hypothetical protein CEE38_16560 [Planctomycetes bacterium B3_Pla]|nr:MAG: hypothetical protein CEE38_16560 [Planctomycetes bacterium B3_Pla]
MDVAVIRPNTWKKSHIIIAGDADLDKGKLISRVLAFAVGAGKAAVSIPYWAAKELPEDRRGLLVAFDDSRALRNAMVELTGDEPQMAEIQSTAHACGVNKFWSKVSNKYWKPLHTRASSRNPTPRPQVGCQWRRMSGYGNSA